MPLSWNDAIAKALETSDEPMGSRAITERIAALGLKSTRGATPAATVAARLSMEIARGDASRFVRVGKGLYDLRARAVVPTAPVEVSDAPASDAPEASEAEAVAGLEAPREALAVRAYGVFWEREGIDWERASPPLLGQQVRGATPVNFAQQRGVYLLHDGRETVNIGRATDLPLVARLRDHTQNRLRSRWNRFSWFGLCAVDAGGHLAPPPSATADLGGLISILEAVLIEVMEPGQNRQGGQALSSSEFLQAEDPNVVERRHKAMVAYLLANR